MTTPTNSKDGTIPDRALDKHSNGPPSTPRPRIFGNNPTPRSDTSEQENLSQSYNTVPQGSD